MPDTPSITIIKSFSYRNVPEEFSNTYHFTGTQPANATAWKALADAIIAAEKLTVPSRVTFVRAYGYEAGVEHSVWGIDYTQPPNSVTPGTAVFTGNISSGDVAATIRWNTQEKNSRGKWIYCRKYMHGVVADATKYDELVSPQRVALGTYAAKLIDGTLPGGFRYSGPQGAVLTDPLVNPYVTTRTLKRRGKRPH